MELLEKFQESLDIDNSKIKNDAEKLSIRYRENHDKGNVTLFSKDEALAYAFARMPATYEVVKKVIEKTFEKNDFKINTVLDVGAGTGSSSIAIEELVNIENLYCYEKVEAMREIGNKIMQNGDDVLKNAIWKAFDLEKDKFDIKTDLVIASYVINELEYSKRIEAVEKLWNATNNLLIIIEPGTPSGFKNILEIRDYLINNNAFIVGPCTHSGKCNLEENDWCNCSVRVNRTKLHKMLKGGISPFEDEKFSYIVFSKEKVNVPKKRILRHPIINKGFMSFKVCTSLGIVEEKISKKDGEYYKRSKKKEIGDILE